ncbi:MAG: ABC-F family ATP-binding cassette domain-containing protein [Clostridia bacterium]|nr:ABC-F family ATP-binding cassette domain-containing protein [Clostridia bacterium]
MPLLTVENVSINFHARQLLDDVTFKINEGDKIAFIGNNGAGKSTLFKIIKGVIKPDGGKVLFHGNTIVGYLSQNMDEQDLSGSTLKPQRLIDLEAELKEKEYVIAANEYETDSSEYKLLMSEYSKLVAEFEALGGYDYEYRIKEALAGLGFKGNITEREDFTTLSGGEKMRVCLAQLIVARPDILLLDEPTNHLDADAVSWLEGFLKSYSGSVFVISHDRYFIDRIANRVIELTDGNIKEYKGNYSDYKRQYKEFMKSQQALVDNLTNELEHQLDVKQTMLSHRNISGYHQREKMVNKLSVILENERAKLSHGVGQMNFTVVPRTIEGDEDKILLSVKNVSKRFDDMPFLFTDVSFDVKATQKLFLCGPNGCGKSTLLTMLLGRQGGFDGQVFISGACECGYMGQFVPFDDETISALDELLSKTDLSETQARNLLARFGFRDIDVYKKINVLSGGERSRLYLCCLLTSRPDILFLDEPTNHLDINSREILEDALCEYNGAIICVSHDRYFIDKCADRILGFIGKRIFEYDNYAEYRKNYSLNSGAESVEPISVSEDNSVSSDDKRNTEAKIESKNRAKERKLVAQKRERFREVEKLIGEREAEQKTLEEKFSSDATPDDYSRYAAVCDELNALYDEYLLLSDEL